MDIVQLDHVQIAMPAGGETLARQFYGTLLRLVEVAKPDALAGRGGCWFETPPEGPRRLQIHLGVEIDFHPARKAHPAFLVKDLEALRLKLQEAGVRLTSDDSLAHVSRFYAADPFGNRIEFIQDGQGFSQPRP